MNNKFGSSTTKLKSFVRLFVSALLIFSISFVVACRPETGKNNNDASPTPTPEKRTDDFEGSLASVQTGNFNFVFAFRRPDGDVFSGDDKKFLKANSPNDTNQWVLTADEKVVIAGSNYKFTAENLTALKKRFAVEDFSPVPAVGGENGNSNQNTAVPSVKPPVSGVNQNTTDSK